MGGFTVASSPSPEAFEDDDDDSKMTMTPTSMMLMRMMVLAHPVMMRCLLDVLPFVTCDKKGGVVLI